MAAHAPDERPSDGTERDPACCSGPDLNARIATFFDRRTDFLRGKQGAFQAGVAFRASRLGAAQAVNFADLDRATMARAIESVLGSASYATAAKEACAVLRARDSVGAASSLLEGLVLARA